MCQSSSPKVGAEGGTRQGVAPRGRAIVKMVLKHFDLDRGRRSLIASQSVFMLDLNGYSTADLRNFPAYLTKIRQQVPTAQWPNQRFLRWFPQHKLTTKTEMRKNGWRHKNSFPNSTLKDFDPLWGNLEEFRVEFKLNSFCNSPKIATQFKPQAAAVLANEWKQQQLLKNQLLQFERRLVMQISCDAVFFFQFRCAAPTA